MASVYRDLNDYPNAVTYFLKSAEVAENNSDIDSARWEQTRFKNRMESYNSVIRQDGRYHKSNDSVRLLGFADLQTPPNLQDAPHYLPIGAGYAPTFSSYLSYRPHGRYLVVVLRDS